MTLVRRDLEARQPFAAAENKPKGGGVLVNSFPICRSFFPALGNLGFAKMEILYQIYLYYAYLYIFDSFI